MVDEENQSPLEDATTMHIDDDDLATKISSFQYLLSTRRSVSSFLPLKHDLRPALDRSLLCAQNAPNHKRTEPFVFKRLLRQTAIDRLAQIAYEVTLQRRSEKDPEGAKSFAERKKVKWSQVPAYLVALVEGQPIQEQAVEANDNLFDEIPFVGPQTERQLEDVSGCCLHRLQWAQIA